MNGKAFKGLELTTATLSGNECIDKNYLNFQLREPVAKDLLLEVSQNCGFTESAIKNKISCLKDDCGYDRKTVCCSFGDISEIDSKDFFVSDRRHDGVTDINFNRNPKIKFLPISVFLKFSNIRTYNAERCAIQEISKRNFEHLLELQTLNLAFNQIEIIKQDTFEGLSDLRTILLSNFFC